MALRQTARLLRRHPRYFAHLAFKRLQFSARYRWVRRHGGENRPGPRPLVYKLMLNWKCNLRCPTCMQWGDVGWVKTAGTTAGEELDWGTVEKVFEARLPLNASFIVSGGEPLLYPHFGRLLRLLKARRRFATVCTNGTRLHEFIEDIDDNPYVAFLISLDGFEPETRRLRGAGVYGRVMANIERLQGLRRPPFLAIQFTVLPENVSCMEEFCEAMVTRGVDWILLNPVWFLSAEQAREYERHLHDRFGVEARTHLGYVMAHELDKEEFRRQLERIKRRPWPIRIASYLKEPEWIQDFFEAPGKLLGNRLCYKQWLRLDVLPDGRVTPCVQFPDVTVGNLATHGVQEVWDGQPNRRFQHAVFEDPLPICAKCNNIYLYDGT